eukprot:Hpha_TRINITY_DN15844_c1_g2::TRINITY_DN15844_c1_g2_i1::g.187190::m.187190/K00948/PRPS, prsA; ribose-phosphate pyrophosphokinase
MKFGHRLLSEFNLDWGLDSYVSYNVLKGLIKDIESAEDAHRLDRDEDFWKQVNYDLQLVVLIFKHLETELQEASVSLRQTPRSQLRKESIFQIYTLGKAIKNYQLLNREAFTRIMKKYEKRTGLRGLRAGSQLGLGGRKKKKEGGDDEEGKIDESGPPKEPILPAERQHTVTDFLDQVDDSYFMNPTKMDVTSELELIVQIYAEAFCDGTTDIAEEVLEKVWALDLRSQPRIVDIEDAHFFKKKYRKREQNYACKLITGSSNRALARNVTKCLGHLRGPCHVLADKYSSGEVNVQILENIRGDDVFVLQSGSHFVSQGREGNSLSHCCMELLLLLHTARLSSAARITAVMPYMPFQSRNQPAAAFAQMVRQMGCDRILTVDLLAGQLQGFYEELPLDNVSVVMEFAKYFRDKLSEMGVDDFASQVCAVSPTSTGVERARHFADVVGCGIATVIRRRKRDLDEQGFEGKELQFSESSEVVGDVKGKVCIMVACIIDEAEIFEDVSAQLKEAGAQKVYLSAVHGLFPGESCEQLNAAPVDEIVTTDTVFQDHHMSICPKLRVLPVAPLLAECIDKVHREESIGTMLKQTAGRMPTPRRASPNPWRRESMPQPMEDEIERHLEGVDFKQVRDEQKDPLRRSPLTEKAPDMSPRHGRSMRQVIQDQLPRPPSRGNH